MKKDIRLPYRLVNFLIKGPILIPALVILVVSSQYYLLSDSLTLGFKPDDWILYFAYKTLGSNPLSQLAAVWAERGLYTTYQVYYMGLLDSLFGLNYSAFHLSNLILKIIATIGLYPLILIIFKKRLLAVLTVVLFSISHSSVGPLEFVVKGSDYLSIIFMEGFLLVYYLLLNKPSKLRYLFLLFLFFILSFSSSPIRMFPLFTVPFLLETFWILRHTRKYIIKNSFIRLSILYLPFIIILLLTEPISLTGNAYGPIGISKKVLEGNWYLVLAPFSGMGYAFITNDYWGRIFGSIMVDNFRDYLNFLLGGPTIIPGIITAFITWAGILRQKLLFFISTTVLNFIAQVLFYFVSSHHLKINSSNVNYDPTNLYSVIFGGYVLVIGLMSLLFWLRYGGRDRTLASLGIGSVFLFIFTLLTWAFAPLGTGFSGTSYYLVVASVGSSLMMAAFLVSIHEKIRIRFQVLALIPFLILIPIFQMSSREVRPMFFFLNQLGRGAEGQILMQKEARKVLKDFNEGDSVLVYIDTSGIGHGQGPFYSEGFLTSFPAFMLLREDRLVEGCVGILYENTVVELRKAIHIQNGMKGFEYPGTCIEKVRNNNETSLLHRSRNLFFTSDRFYAFKIEDKKLIDIKKEVLDQLEIDYSK